MLFQGVAGVRPGGICAAWEHVGLAANFDDVWGVAAPCPFGVEGVDGAASNGADCVFYKAGFIQGVCVDAHLHIKAIGYP